VEEIGDVSEADEAERFGGDELIDAGLAKELENAFGEKPGDRSTAFCV